MNDLIPDLEFLQSIGPWPLTWLICYIVGLIIKHGTPIPNGLIPFLAPVLGTVLLPLLADPATVNFRYPVVALAVMGFIVGTMTTWSHEVLTAVRTALRGRSGAQAGPPPGPPHPPQGP